LDYLYKSTNYDWVSAFLTFKRGDNVEVAYKEIDISTEVKEDKELEELERQMQERSEIDAGKCRSKMR